MPPIDPPLLVSQDGLDQTTTVDAESIPLREAVRAWSVVAVQTFGGPAGQIAVMHREIVDDRRWVSDERFLHALSFCSLLPGPEAQQLATYLGWLLNGIRGGLIAGSLFVLPGYVAIMALSMIYAGYGETKVVAGVFAGVSAAVIAIVAQAVSRVAKRSLVTPLSVAVAVAAFASLFVFAVAFPAIVVAAALIGFVVGRFRPAWVRRRPAAHGSSGSHPAASARTIVMSDVRPTWSRAAKFLGIGLAAWLLPVVVLASIVGTHSILIDQARFFSGSALVTFGGAYAVLSYVAQRAVETYGWLTPSEMVSGLAMAETTPGPLIQVVQFVAFIGAFRHPGSLDPWVASIVAATIVTWVTYVPSFIFVFIGAPSIESLRGNRDLASALSAISAAVVGVMANLAVYFASHTLFRRLERVRYGVLRVDLPNLLSLNWRSAVVAVLASALIFGRKWPILRVLGLSAIVGTALYFT